jgi:uncharacterized repeat protein (TIGR02543 family)
MKATFRRTFRRGSTLAAVTLAALAIAPLSAQTQGITVFGSLANFDVYNDTGQDAYGFQIELDGVTPQQVLGSFPATRYGAPSIVPFTGGVYLRYAAQWNPQTQAFSAATTVPSSLTPTLGHACVLTLVNGCDHYGVVLSTSATNTVMRWLVADPANPGSVIPYGGAPVSIPLPSVTIIPPQQPNQAPAVAFEIHMPDPPAVQWGEPRWVKVFKTELPQEVALDELVGGNPVVPQDPAQVETAMKLLQKNPRSANSGILHNQGTPGNGSHAIVRRYEFYKYIGKRDPLTGEALCIDPTCGTADPSEIGDYIGDQMAAANIGVPSVTVTRTGNGTVVGVNGKINCGGTCTTLVAAGAEVTLTANPGGTVFSGWGGPCNGTDLNCTFVVNDAVNVTATFTPMYTLSIGRSGVGTVTGNPAGLLNTQINCGGSCSAKFAQGTVVNLTAAPGAGLSFTGWTGACSGTAPTCSVTITADTKVQANFK